MEKITLKNRCSRTIVSVVLIALLIQLVPIKNARAVLGVGDIVNDPIHTALTSIGFGDTAARWIWDYTFKVALEALKRRLLAIMTNNVVEWINSGGVKKPKFTQDFGEVFREAGDAAIGDVLSQYSLTKPLCEPFDFDITFQLQQPQPLADQVRCSLSSVIKNIKDYRSDFKNGGWIGYQELLKPQNNQWGVEIITKNEIINRTAQNTNASILKQTVGSGFASISQCTGGWDLIDTKTGKPINPKVAESISVQEHISAGDLYAGKVWDDPETPPPHPVGTSGLEYKCAGSTITTPGRTVAATLDKAIIPDFDYIINSQDLTNSLAIIADAAFNKLIKTGVKGLQDFSKQTSEPTPEQKTAIESSPEYQGYQNSQSQQTGIVRNGLLNQLKPAASAALTASTTLTTASSTNQGVITTGGEILTCLSSQGSHPDISVAQYAIDSANSMKKVITTKYAEVKNVYGNINGMVTAANSCIDTSCLSQISQESVNNSISSANELKNDSNIILLEIQRALADLQARKLNDCH